MLVLCLFSHRNIQFAKYNSFRVLGYMCLLTKFHILFWDFEVIFTPIFKCYDSDDVFTFL
jgi:hypothetical protein